MPTRPGRGQQIGDGTPDPHHHPDAEPVGPIRILALGKTGQERIDADVYLTDRAPAFLPAPTGSNGMRLDHSAARLPCSSTTFEPTRAWAGSRRPAG